MSKRKTFNVLSIDGGGIRGIIPAMVLAEIEERTDKKIYELFDLIAGTSTGGILALALTRPDPNPSDSNADLQPAYAAECLVRLYRCRGRDIFDKSRVRKIPLIGRLVGLFDELYSSDGIEDVLEEYFGNTRLSDALTSVLIPSYDMQGTRRYWTADAGDPFRPEPRRNQGGSPRFFKSDRAKRFSYENYLMQDVARATSAAPTYFEPHKVRFDVRERFYETLVDGGIFANNPAMCAYAEARRKIDESGFNKEILLVSLGTGELTKELNYHEARDWGKLGWVEPLLRMIFDGASDTVHYQLRQLLGNGNNGGAYYRFQPVLTEGKDAMDDVSETNLTSLRSLAYELITENSDLLGSLCSQLESREENS